MNAEQIPGKESAANESRVSVIQEGSVLANLSVLFLLFSTEATRSLSMDVMKYSTQTDPQ